MHVQPQFRASILLADVHHFFKARVSPIRQQTIKRRRDGVTELHVVSHNLQQSVVWMHVYAFPRQTMISAPYSGLCPCSTRRVAQLTWYTRTQAQLKRSSWPH